MTPLTEALKYDNSPGAKGPARGMQICPRCGDENDDDWPLKISGEILDGGCQVCWEAQCSESWWKMVEKMAELQGDADEGDEIWWYGND